MAERKFAALADLRRRPELPADEDAPPRGRVSEPPPEPPAPVIQAPPLSASPPDPTPPPATATPPAPVATLPSALVPVDVQKGRGRPPGKRSDPDWAPRTILMRSKIHRRVSIMLLEQDNGPDLSELVDQLLTDWISKQA